MCRYGRSDAQSQIQSAAAATGGSFAAAAQNRRRQHHSDRIYGPPGVWRDKNAASGIGTNFASVPYGNTAAGHLSEFRFSPQNSRLGFRTDANGRRPCDRLQRVRLSGHQRRVQPGCDQRRVRAARSFVLGRRPQGPVGVSRGPELEYADAQSQGHFTTAGRHLLQPGDGRQLPCGFDLDSPTRRPLHLSPER